MNDRVLLLAAVPPIVGAATASVAGRLARRLPPGVATVLLTVLALAVALSCGILLCLTACLGVVQRVPLVRPYDWSPDALRTLLPVPVVVAAGAGLIAAVLLARAIAHLVRVVIGARHGSAAVADLPVAGDLAVVDDAAVYAYTVPGRGGRVVVSTGMLRVLDGPQRRALLAHEHAHLRYHHHLYAQSTRLAAAANPLLRPVVRAVDEAIERWADAVAVREVGDPAVVAHALGRAALSGSTLPAYALGAGHSDVVGRVRDLLEPPRHRRYPGVLLVIAAAACVFGTSAVLLHTHDVIEIAEIAYHRLHSR